MDRKEWNDRSPIAGDVSTNASAEERYSPADIEPAPPVKRLSATPPLRSTPASSPPLPLHDLACLPICSRRDALRLMAAAALLSTPAAAVDDLSGDEARWRRLEARLAADSRLDQRISFIAWAEPLEDVLARLSRESRVAFAFEGRDTGDQRVNIVVKDQPLRRVMALLAEALDLYWQRDRKAPAYRYMLFQDTRSRKLEQELLSLARARFEEGVRRTVDSLKLTPAEIEELRARDFAAARRLTDPDRRTAVELLGRLAPRHWERLMQVGRVELPYADLSPRDQELARKYREILKERETKREQELNIPGQRQVGDISQPGGRIVIQFYNGVPVGPDTELGVNLEPAHGFSSGNALGLGYTGEEWKRLREEFLPPRFRKEGRGSLDDAGPRVSVKWKDRVFLRWETVLKSVAEAADLQIISDSYLYYWHESHSTLPAGAALRDRPLAEVLDQVATPFFYAWRRAGDVTLFRHWNWFIEKRHNIPERDLRRWQEHLKPPGRLTLEDTAELAQLTDRQLELLYHTSIPTRAVRDHRKLLRLYAALNPFQQTRLERTGLRLGDLNGAQAELLRTWEPTATENAEARLRLRRESEAVVFTLASNTPAPLEERIALERGRTPPTD